jgi:L-2-hydroxyglutarate oxidase LhgO
MLEVDADAVVAGAGVVGLAVARALALQGRSVLVVEANEGIGRETSSRNSEVIHAGIYYPNGSLKARTCVRGRRMLYDYLHSRGIPHRQCQKLIVVTRPEQLGVLDTIRERAVANGVEDLRALTAREAVALEPDLTCVGAILSPSTGILDSHAYMESLQGEAEQAGALFGLRMRVARGEALGDRGTLLWLAGDEAMRVRTRVFVNCAGHGAPMLADAIDGFPPGLRPQTWYAKGSYFQLARRSPFTRLVYPAPEPGGLGVHLTLDLAGQARFGPDVEWVDHLDYTVRADRSERFYAAIRAYWPALRDGDLVPAYAGVRPKVAGPGAPDADFMIIGPREHGLEGQVHLFGIESPGLTASLALAQEVLARLDGS